MLTRTKVPPLHDERLEEVTVVRPGRRPPLGRWLGEDGVVAGWPTRLGWAWAGVFGLAMALAPAPADPHAAEPLWSVALVLGLFAVLGVMAAGLVRRQRLGLVASVAAGGVALLGTVLCPVSGHHETIGAWWYLQMAGFTGLVGASLAGLRRTRTTA